MEDGKVVIKTEIDTSGVDKGLQNVKKNLDGIKKPTDNAKKSTDNLNKSLKDINKSTKETTSETKTFSGGLKDFASSALLPVASITAVIASLKKLVEGMREASLAYRAQSDGETMLSLAIKNNPYFTGEAENRLKSYAKELQNVTGYTDNEVLESMQKLIANGRKEAEVFDIIGVATNLAVKEGIDLASATDMLNATYSGMAGTLGKHNAAIKNLTQEQLKNGEAVRLTGEAVKDYATSTVNADVLTSRAKEDFNEAMGKFIDPLSEAWDNFWKKFYKKGAEAITGVLDAGTIREAKELLAELDAPEKIKGLATEDLSEYTRVIENEIERLEKLTEKSREKNKDDLQWADETEKNLQEEYKIGKLNKEVYESQLEMIKQFRLERIGETQEELENQKNMLALLSEEKQIRDKATDEANKKKIAEEKEQEVIQKKLDDEKSLLDYIEANTKAREKALQALEEQARLRGEEVTDAERLQVLQASYVDLIANSDNRLTHESEQAKELLATTQELYQAELDRLSAEERKQKIIDDTQELERMFAEIMPELESQRLKQQLEDLENFYNSTIDLLSDNTDERKRLEEEFAEVKIKLTEKITEAEKKENAIVIKSWQDKASDMLDIASQFMSEYTNMMASITALAQKAIDARVGAEQQALDEKYQKGLISAEEYEGELLKLDKEAKREKYKLDMWEWGTNLANSIVNTAVAFTKALTSSAPPLNFILAGLVASAGAAQAALIGANKPQPPAFATGGIVGGTSYTGDRVSARVNSGEMIINREQQRRLFEQANGIGGKATQIKIYNKASNEIKAQPQITEEGINFVVEKIVSKQMAEGRYNNAFNAMQNSLSGRRYQ
jgi:hypothetical protein